VTVERTPVAAVSGPVTGGRGWPFGSPLFDVAELGYVMEEFLLDGVACSYIPAEGAEIGRDGIWATEIGDVAPYRTRIYVVRPVDAARFNGVVLVNWQNVTAGVDLGTPSESDLRHGYAWVGVTTQLVAVEGRAGIEGIFPPTEGLPAWDPERYGSLRHPGDAYCYDIYSQAGRAVGPNRPAAPFDPLRGLKPRMLLAIGGSQSAMRLGSYLNLSHARDRVYDGFFPYVHWGLCPYPPDQDLQVSFEQLDGGWYAGSSRIRDDTGTPILVLASETETMNNYPVRQPDSESFRFWEMAGTAHAGAETADMEQIFVRDGLPNVLSFDDMNTVDWQYIRCAAQQRLVDWVDSGRPPISIPPIEVDPGPPASIRRDRFGNALGGIRLPELEAPTARHSGTNSSNPLAALAGESVPLSSDQIAELYPDPSAYEKAWDAAVDRLVADGLVLPDDIERLRARGRDVALAAPK
jgi:Alpha/beta hydrolase domain